MAQCLDGYGSRFARSDHAQKVGFDRPYNQAQELISRWQLEIEDVGHLERARELAQGGTVGINTCDRRSRTHPRYKPARLGSQAGN